MTPPAAGPAARWSAEFVEIDASDGRRLEGLLHHPRGPRQPTGADLLEGRAAPAAARASVLLLHGKGANCYSGVSRFLPPLLADAGIRTLALNMRSHDLGYTRMDVPFVDLEDGPAQVDGGMWENLVTAQLDVAAGIRFLIDEGAPEVALCGHSSGGFYAALHDPADVRVSSRVLLSPLVSQRRPLDLWFGGEGELAGALALARDMVEAGRGEQLIPTPLWYYAISARALLQRAAEPDGRFVGALAGCGAPILVAWGSLEGRGEDWDALAGQFPHVSAGVIEGAEHNYLGSEESVARLVADHAFASLRY
ncbi:MAG: alpha/beta fold hydrolase [Micromonosporaceae bacterium]